MARLDRQTLDALTAQVMRQLSFHTETIAPPSGFQFVLPEGRFLTLNDYLLRGRRVIMFSSVIPVTRPTRRVSANLSRPRKLAQDGPWFVGYTDGQLRSATKTVRYAIDFAWRNDDDGRVEEMLLVDPGAEARRLERPADWKPAATPEKETR